MNANGMQIAHLSDVHMLAPPSRSRSGWSMRHHFLSFGRPLDAMGRRRKLVRALSAARRAGAAHIVLSGDLTETGAPSEFEALAEALHDSAVRPEQLTLVPGNHDLYTSPEGWRWALRGPLSAFAQTSACEPGRIVECAGVRLLPLDTTVHQPVTRAGGLIRDDALSAVEQRATDPKLLDRPLVVVQHHPPFVRNTRALEWLDGLAGAARMMALLERFRHLFLLHGHLHKITSRVLACGVARVFGATAVVDDRVAPRVRFYEVRSSKLQAMAH